MIDLFEDGYPGYNNTVCFAPVSSHIQVRTYSNPLELRDCSEALPSGMGDLNNTFALVRLIIYGASLTAEYRCGS